MPRLLPQAFEPVRFMRSRSALQIITGPLIGEVIGLSDNADGDAEVYFGPLRLGTLDG